MVRPEFHRGRPARGLFGRGRGGISKPHFTMGIGYPPPRGYVGLRRPMGPPDRMMGHSALRAAHLGLLNHQGPPPRRPMRPGLMPLMSAQLNDMADHLEPPLPFPDPSSYDIDDSIMSLDESILQDNMPPSLRARIGLPLRGRGYPDLHMMREDEFSEGIGRGDMLLRSRGMIPFRERGMSPRGIMPLRGRGMMPLRGSGMIPLRGSGMIPLRGSGMIPLRGSGMMPLRGSGMMPLRGSGIMPLRARGMMPLRSRGMMPLRGRGMMPLRGRGMMFLGGMGMVPLRGMMRGRGMMPMRGGRDFISAGPGRGMPPIRGRGSVRGQIPNGKQPPQNTYALKPRLTGWRAVAEQEEKRRLKEIAHPWMTEELRIEIRARQRLLVKYKRSRNRADHTPYRIQRNKIHAMLREAKDAYIDAHPDEDISKCLAQARQIREEKRLVKQQQLNDEGKEAAGEEGDEKVDLEEDEEDELNEEELNEEELNEGEETNEGVEEYNGEEEHQDDGSDLMLASEHLNDEVLEEVLEEATESGVTNEVESVEEQVADHQTLSL